MALVLPSLALSPALGAVVLADDIATTTFIQGVSLPGYIGWTGVYAGKVEPTPTGGTVTFQASTDGGTTWTNVASAPVDSGGYANVSATITGVPGPRLVRASYGGTTGFAPSVSSNFDQELVARTPGTITGFTWTPSVVLPGTTSITMRATLYVPTSEAGVSLRFEEYVNGVWTLLGAPSLLGAYPAEATLVLPGMSEGTHTVRARFPGTEHYAPSTVTKTMVVAKDPVTVLVEGPTQVQAHHTFTLGVRLTNYLSIPPTGTLALKKGTEIKATGSVAAGVVKLLGPINATGTYTFHGTYSGDVNYLPATSAPFTVTVVPDTVDATAVTVTPATFYPYADSYGDSTWAKGTRTEPLSVAIRIYSSGGTLVRSASLARASGAYSYAWNGRNSTGGLLAAGTYKVNQTLTDAFGTTKTFTNYVTLSHKRIYTYTTYVTKTAAQYTKRSTGWIGWEFTMPSATIYKSITFQAYAKSTTVPPSQIGGWDTRRCAWTATWSPTCVSHSASVGLATAWYSVALDTKYERNGRLVRGFIYAPVIGSGVVSQARIKVVYGVLK